MKQVKTIKKGKLFKDRKNNRTRQDITKPGKSTAGPEFTVNKHNFVFAKWRGTAATSCFYNLKP